MELTSQQQKMLSGSNGRATQKSMEILCALGEIYGAKKLIPVASVQIAGVSYDNLGDAGLDYLAELAKDGKVKVLTTLNPAGMDLKEWKKLGISEEFADKQLKVVDAFYRMGVVTSCTCTPYLVGNLPRFGESVAWSESSAVAFGNSVLGIRTNREGGPSALAAALTGFTPEYGLHLDQNRQAQVEAKTEVKPKSTEEFGALGCAIGKKIGNKIPLITGIRGGGMEELKSFSASIATYGGTALYHIKGITPNRTKRPAEKVTITKDDFAAALKEMTDEGDDVDLVGLGCPHASIHELAMIADLLKGKKVKAEMWVCTARQTKDLADTMGYTKVIEDAGAKVAADTCMVVAPIKSKFKVMATDSAKGCYYARGKNKFKTKIGSLKDCVKAAITGKWKA